MVGFAAILGRLARTATKATNKAPTLFNVINDAPLGRLATSRTGLHAIGAIGLYKAGATALDYYEETQRAYYGDSYYTDRLRSGLDMARGGLLLSSGLLGLRAFTKRGYIPAMSKPLRRAGRTLGKPLSGAIKKGLFPHESSFMDLQQAVAGKFALPKKTNRLVAQLKKQIRPRRKNTRFHIRAFPTTFVGSVALGTQIGVKENKVLESNRISPPQPSTRLNFQTMGLVQALHSRDRTIRG
ncbi:MAG: hypothetical protein D6698_06820 [Gammaproteobacteria bacterium]|nr:MAG: hypothetical protein D6698_06820 [Gammaproteobacteria bacterium]